MPYTAVLSFEVLMINAVAQNTNTVCLCSLVYIIDATDETHPEAWAISHLEPHRGMTDRREHLDQEVTGREKGLFQLLHWGYDSGVSRVRVRLSLVAIKLWKHKLLVVFMNVLWSLYSSITLLKPFYWAYTWTWKWTEYEVRCSSHMEAKDTTVSSENY